MFYRKSTITLEDNSYDIYNTDEANIDIFENDSNSEQLRMTPPDLPVAKR